MMMPSFRLFAVSSVVLCLTALVRADALPDSPNSARVEPIPTADHVVVRKSQRRLYLMRGESVLRSYKVALGLNPVGHKERSGDFRTPEGRYLPDPPQSTQRLLSLDPGLLPERR